MFPPLRVKSPSRSSSLVRDAMMKHPVLVYETEGRP